MSIVQDWRRNRYNLVLPVGNLCLEQCFYFDPSFFSRIINASIINLMISHFHDGISLFKWRNQEVV